MKTVPVERLRYVFIYDPLTGILTHRIDRGQRARAGKEAGGMGHAGYRLVSVDGVVLLAHRIAWAIHTGMWPEGHIDHINGVKSDNRICNLRVASNAENLRNQRKRVSNSSGVKGVSWNKQKQKWTAQIGIDGKDKYLGSFDNLNEAASCYQKAATELHKSFANFG